MPRPRTGAAPETPKVLEKALRVLESFTNAHPERSEAELARELELPTTTANRILRGLEERAFLTLLPSGRYCLGPIVVQLGRRAAASLDYASVLAPILERAARETGELVMLAVAAVDQRAARYVATIDSPRRLRVTLEVGSTVPLTAGATAKALLAGLPPDVLDGVLARPLVRLAEGSLVDPRELREDLSRTRERGWSRSWEETDDGAWAVAAPILDPTGEALAAIGVATPTRRHSAEVEAATVRVVIGAAADAARTLGLRARPTADGSRLRLAELPDAPGI